MSSAGGSEPSATSSKQRVFSSVGAPSELQPHGKKWKEAEVKSETVPHDTSVGVRGDRGCWRLVRFISSA